jgi:hypothetical protein
MQSRMKSEPEAPARMVYDVDRKALYELIHRTTDGNPIASFDYGYFTSVLPDDPECYNLEMLFVDTDLYHGPELDGGDPTYDEDNEPAENGPLPSVAQWDQYEEACHKALLRTRVTHIWEYFLTYWKRLKDLRSVIYGLAPPGLSHSEVEYRARQAYMKACKALDPVKMVKPSDLTARLARLDSLFAGSSNRSSEGSFMTLNAPSPLSDRHTSTYDSALTAILHNRAVEREAMDCNTDTLSRSFGAFSLGQ